MSGAAASGIRAAIRERFDSLPKRTQVLLMVGSVVLAMGWVFFLWFFLGGTLTETEQLMTSRNTSLHNLQTLQSRFDDATQRIAAAEERLGKNEGVAPSAFLEKAARDIGWSDELSGITDRDSEMMGSLKQPRYQVVVKKAPIKQVMDFIYVIEESGFMALENVELTTAFAGGERRLNARIDLIAYAAKKEGS